MLDRGYNSRKEIKRMFKSSDIKVAKIKIENMTEIGPVDMNDLCEATEKAIEKGGGFGWVKTPGRQVLERYWKGVILVPNRDLFVGRIDGTIAGAVQLIRQPNNNEAQGFSVKIISTFVAPWGRGFGVGREMMSTLEKFAKKKGIQVVRLDVRETQKDAIKFFKACGYTKWGTNPLYAKVKNKIYCGFYFQKDLTAEPKRDKE